MQTRSKSGIFKPKVFFAKQKINTLVIEPTSVEQALLDTNWKKAIEDEYNAPLSNNTWSLVPYIEDIKPVDNKWIFQVKYNLDSSIQIYKA